ncbi:DoxX-like protein [Ulvibacter sp. MAR_2010_11]|uniref:DoxX-like family protein n=1 Tax=Ulvibacter sp. MAR_2010_11 TaxID=1250229 RepID=UPI000C2C6FC8|nr:DoxX-like family protein [Ulvibacter sp. MAR_2010_11]PKA83406.1 DoxX-like protein [Ulvibacter sp. MAR_2010_11]
MKSNNLHALLNYLIAGVWLFNGLYCKLFHYVPRHQEIIGYLLGGDNAGLITKIIGFAEVLMALWILSRIKSRLNAIVQIVVIMLMNLIEFVFVPDLLLWGKLNVVFAILFTLLIYFNEFHLKKRNT